MASSAGSSMPSKAHRSFSEDHRLAAVPVQARLGGRGLLTSPSGARFSAQHGEASLLA